MRSVPSDISSKLAMTKQTKANSAEPSADIWIGRPTTVLTTDTFLERQTVLSGDSITDTSVAVCHPHQGRENTKINIGYIDNGIARVITAAVKAKITNHIWVDSGFEETADAISVAYDGTMPKNESGLVEFVTESQPWIFWANSGALYAQKLGNSTVITLAESNCTGVSAIRAMWSDVGGFDFGLVVFFILAGSLYYRQYIAGEWMDAAPISFGPNSVTWTKIAAFRTWDYRVGVQAKTSDGDIYELFTQFMGIGKQTAEHIELTSVEADSELITVTYTDTKEEENVEITNISAVSELLYGFSSLPVSAINVDDGSGDYGYTVQVALDYPVTGLSGNGAAFTLEDGYGITWTSTEATSIDGLTIIITFPDFNSAYGDVTLSYSPGTIQSPAVAMEAWESSFTPINLVPPAVDPPEVESIWNE